MSFRDALVLRAAALWTVFVWGTRIRNLIGDDRSTGFKVVHVTLALISVAFALALWTVAARNRGKAAAGARRRGEKASETD